MFEFGFGVDFEDYFDIESELCIKKGNTLWLGFGLLHMLIKRLLKKELVLLLSTRISCYLCFMAKQLLGNL